MFLVNWFRMLRRSALERRSRMTALGQTGGGADGVPVESRAALKTILVAGKPFLISGRAGDSNFDHLGEGNANAFLSRVAKLLPRDAAIFDVGANMGVTTAILAGNLDNATIYDFEPSPEAFPYLVETLKLNGLTECYPINIALGATVGQLSFLHNTNSSSASHLVTQDSLGAGNATVQVSTIDHEIDSRSIKRLDFIKMDVEGFEIDVLDGAEKTLRTLRPKVFLEFNTFTMMAFRNVYPRAFLERLISQFPYVYRHRDSGQLSVVRTGAQQIEFIHDNLITKGCVDDLLCCWNAID